MLGCSQLSLACAAKRVGCFLKGCKKTNNKGILSVMNISVLSLVLFAHLVSIVVVRRVNSHRHGEPISWRQAAWIVFIRSGSAVSVGYLLGVLLSQAAELGIVVDVELIAGNIFTVLLIISFCSATSFLAFKWAFGMITNRHFSLSDAIRSVVREFLFYVKMLVVLFPVVVIVLFTLDAVGFVRI